MPAQESNLARRHHPAELGDSARTTSLRRLGCGVAELELALRNETYAMAALFVSSLPEISATSNFPSIATESMAAL
jgi:hypothetical protein